ncbi:MAG: TolC family protein [Candidatus Aceula meridiana]|nr:TolC family protein [Candidatus Aceula meridiana]
MMKKRLIYILIFSAVCYPALAAAQTDIETIIQNSIATAEARRLSLEEVTRLAFENNFDIQLAKFDAKIARTRNQEAVSIYDAYLNAEVSFRKDKSTSASSLAAGKTVNNDYDVGLSKKLPTGTTVSIDQTNNRQWTDSTAVIMNPSHNSSLGLTVEQNLGKNFFGIQDRGDVKITQLDVKNSEYLSLDKIEKSIFDVQVAYWDVVLAQEVLKIEKEVLAQAKKLYDTNQEKIADGLVEQPEFIASETNYKQNLINASIAKNSLQTKKNILKLLLNISDDMSEVLPSQEFLTQDGDERLEESLKKAFSQRRDYRQALNTIKMKNINLSMKKNNTWPEINLKASMARNGLGEHFKQSVTSITQENNPDFLASLSVSFPLENRSAKAQLKKAEYQKAQALLSFKLLERKIMIEIVDQVRECNILRENAKGQKEIAQLESKKFFELQKIFSYGRSDIDTLIRYQREASLAHQSAALAAFNYQVALIKLRMSEGILLTESWQEGI